MADWKVGAARNLKIVMRPGWDGPAAQKNIFGDGDTIDQAQAKRGHLVYDASAPELRGSYKLSFCDLVSGELVAISGGLRACASRLPQTDIPDNVKKNARGVIDGYQKKMADMKESKEYTAQVLKHFGLDEAVRTDQSYEAKRAEIMDALNEWPGRPADMLWIAWTFADRVIACACDNDGEYCSWEIPYTLEPGVDEDGDAKYTFGTPVEVEQVTTYEPATGGGDMGDMGDMADMGESIKPKPTKPANRQKLTEIIECVLVPLTERASDPPGGKRVKAIGMTADIINANGRRYSRSVLADAITRLNGKLNESAGQGRLILTGEAEHPNDKATKKPHVLETVFKWDAVSLNSAGQVALEGIIIPTSKGRDLQTIAAFGVPIKLSQRGYGEMESVTESGRTFDEVTYLEITGYDAVAQPSDPTAGLTESKQERKKPMTLEELLALLEEKPEMLEAISSRLSLASKKEIAESLGTTPEMLKTRLGEALAAKTELDELKRKEAIEEAIKESTKDLPYGELNASFVDSVRAANPTKPADVSAIVESKLKEWDIVVSKMKLQNMGYNSGVRVLGPVFERETGQAEFTKPAWYLNESLISGGNGKRRALAKADFGSMLYTAKILKLFDEKYKKELMIESRNFDEAEATTDLNLPYTVMRAIIEQAYPELIAANIFDFGIADSSPTRLYFEAYAGETGVVVAVTSETVVGAFSTWVALANHRLVPGTVTVTNSGATVTYVEGVDYVIDYGDGKIYTLSTGATTDGQSLRANYTYDAYRKGELAEIERAKNTLTFKTLEIAADRLAVEISTEAVVFSRSQMGYDATGRTIANIMRLIRRKVDQDILYEAIGAALIVPNNSGGTWASSSDTLDAFATKLGVTRTKIYNHFYVPTAFIMSSTNADRLSNWTGFTRLGFPNAMLEAAGFAGSVKGLPIFASPEFSDGYALAVNRELVMHRVFQPMQLKGPFPSYSNGKLVAAEAYYVEEFSGTDAPVPQKGAYMIIT
jgi:hypothetical protein